MKYIFICCLICFSVFATSLIMVCLSYKKMDNTYVRNEEFKHFVYWSILSHIESINIFIKDEDDFIIFAKAYLCEKIRDDLYLDEEFMNVISRYPAFSLYEYISKIIDEDLGFRNELHDRFIKIQSTDKEEDDYLVDQEDEENDCKIYNFTDITKELIDFTK